MASPPSRTAASLPGSANRAVIAAGFQIGATLSTGSTGMRRLERQPNAPENLASGGRGVGAEGHTGMPRHSQRVAVLVAQAGRQCKRERGLLGKRPGKTQSSTQGLPAAVIVQARRPACARRGRRGELGARLHGGSVRRS